MKKSVSVASTNESMAWKCSKKEVWMAVIFLVLIIVFGYIRGEKTVSVQYNDGMIELSSPLGECYQIPLQDIKSLELRTEFQNGENMSGQDTNVYRFGKWKNNEFGTYILCMATKVNTYLIVTTDSTNYVINFDSDDTISNFYLALEELVKNE